MKKLFFLSLILECSLLTQAQFIELGMNENEIYGYHRYDNLTPHTDANGRFLEQKTTMGTMTYNFDSMSICKSVILYVDNTNVSASLIKQYNDKYDTINDGVWRVLNSDKTLYYYIMKTGDIFTYFTIPKWKVDESEKHK